MTNTEIQKKYIERIEKLSRELGIEIRDLYFRPDQKYVSGKISDYSFWIYDTGDSDFSSEWYDRRFEIYGFKNEEDILNAFIDSLKDAINRKDYFREHPDKSPPPVFNRLIDWISKLWKNPKNEKK